MPRGLTVHSLDVPELEQAPVQARSAAPEPGFAVIDTGAEGVANLEHFVLPPPQSIASPVTRPPPAGETMSFAIWAVIRFVPLNLSPSTHPEIPAT